MPLAMKSLYIALAFLLLAGCASGPRLNTSHPSVNHDNRVQFVVVHYTSTNLERSLALLTHGQVSSHYLIGDDASGTIYKLVDESQRAWHAGESEWMGRTWLNSSSIGIEIVNPGFSDTPTGRVWYPYSEAQVQSLIVLLKDISKRNGIDPKNTSGTATSPHCASWTQARCSLGNAWRQKVWPCGRMPRQWPGSRCSTPRSYQALPGSRKSWRAWATRRRRLASWMWPRGTSSPRSRCASGHRCLMALRMLKVPQSCGP